MRPSRAAGRRHTAYVLGLRDERGRPAVVHDRPDDPARPDVDRQRGAPTGASPSAATPSTGTPAAERPELPRGGREVLPVMELISTLVQGSPGADGLYRSRVGDEVIRHHLEVARRHHALLLLDIQPGRADLLEEVEHYRRWLAEPDVGLALDPEWEVGPDSVPMKVFGHTTGEELDAVSRYVAGIVRAHDLPQKVVVYHQLNRGIVRDPQALRPRRGVAMVQSVDGIGVPQDKGQTWRRVVRRSDRIAGMSRRRVRIVILVLLVVLVAARIASHLLR